MDHSIVNIVLRQKGSFSVPGKGKQYSDNYWAQAMRPINREGLWDCTARAKSDIYDCLVCNVVSSVDTRMIDNAQ